MLTYFKKFKFRGKNYNTIIEIKVMCGDELEATYRGLVGSFLLNFFIISKNPYKIVFQKKL